MSEPTTPVNIIDNNSMISYLEKFAQEHFVSLKRLSNVYEIIITAIHQNNDSFNDKVFENVSTNFIKSYSELFTVLSQFHEEFSKIDFSQSNYLIDFVDVLRRYFDHFAWEFDNYRKNYLQYKEIIVTLYQSSTSIAYVIDDNIKYVQNVGINFERDRKSNIEVFINILGKLLKMQDYLDVLSAMYNYLNDYVECDEEVTQFFQSTYNSYNCYIRNLKRQQVIDEIISTENVYIFNLNELVSKYIKPIYENRDKLTDKPNKISLFKEILTKIKNLNTNFLNEIKNARSQKNQTMEVIEVFIKFSKDFEIYSEYACNYEDFKSFVCDLIKFSQQFNEYLSGCSEGGEAQFFSWLITPIQKFPKYALFLRELQKFSNETDRHSKALEIAIKFISNTGELINFSIKAREIVKLEKKFKNDIKLTNAKRLILHNGLLKKECKFKSKIFLFHLFSDAIMCSEEQTNGQLKFKQLVNLSDVRNVTLNEENSCSFLLKTKSDKYVLSARNELDSNTQVKKINEAILANLDESTTSFNSDNSNSNNEKNYNMGIHYYAEYNDFDGIRGSIKNGDDVNMINQNGETALHLAARKGNFESVKYLIKAGADMRIKTNFLNSASHLAAESNHFKIVKFLIDSGDYQNAKGAAGNTLCHISVKKGNLQMLQFLVIEVKVDADIKNNEQHTPVHLAAKFGYLELLKCLIENYEIKINLRDSNGNTALHFAVSGDLLNSLYETEKKRRSSFDLNERFSFDKKESNIRNEMVSFLLEQNGCEPDLINKEGNTPLHLASKFGNAKICGSLLSAGANSSIQNMQGDKPVHIAAQSGNFNVIKFMINEFNISCNEKNKEGNAPIHLAAIENHLPIVELLTNKLGIEANCTNFEYLTPLEIAKRQNNSEMIEYLKKQRNNLDQNALFASDNIAIGERMSAERITLSSNFIKFEQKYYGDILSLNRIFIKPIEEKKISKIEKIPQVSVFLGSFSQILKISVQFLEELNIIEELKEPETKIIQIFNKFLPNFSIYGQYAFNYLIFYRVILNFVSVNSKFSTFYEKCSSLSKHSLESLLILPVMQVQQYSVFVKNLLKNSTEDKKYYHDIEKLCSELQSSATLVHELSKEGEKRAAIYDLSLKFENNVQLISNNREIIYSGNLKVMSKKAVFYVHLFSDLLTISKESWRGNFKLNKKYLIKKTTQIFKSKNSELEFSIKFDYPKEKTVRFKTETLESCSTQIQNFTKALEKFTKSSEENKINSNNSKNISEKYSEKGNKKMNKIYEYYNESTGISNSTYENTTFDSQSSHCSSLNFSNIRQGSIAHNASIAQQNLGNIKVANESARKILSELHIPIIEAEELETVKEIAEGASASVFLGNWQSNKVAIKMFRALLTDQNTIHHFAKEISVQNQLRHPLIVRLYGACIDYKANICCIVMPYYTKGSLYSVLRDNNISLPQHIRYKIAYQIAGGMRLLHGRNILHRDLKSLNVLLTSSLNALLSDFGLAHVREASQSFCSKNSHIVGTIFWLDPNILAKKTSYNRHTDVYSFAVTLCEIASRNHPYPQLDAMSFGFECGRNPDLRPEIPSSCPPNFKNLIENCQSKNIRNRPLFDDICSELKKLVEAECQKEYAILSVKNDSESKNQLKLVYETADSVGIILNSDKEKNEQLTKNEYKPPLKTKLTMKNFSRNNIQTPPNFSRNCNNFGAIDRLKTKLLANTSGNSTLRRLSIKKSRPPIRLRHDVTNIEQNSNNKLEHNPVYKNPATITPSNIRTTKNISLKNSQDLDGFINSLPIKKTNRLMSTRTNKSPYSYNRSFAVHANTNHTIQRKQSNNGSINFRRSVSNENSRIPPPIRIRKTDSNRSLRSGAFSARTSFAPNGTPRRININSLDSRKRIPRYPINIVRGYDEKEINRIQAPKNSALNMSK